MSSPSAAKIAANQANAQHSTGPRTESGQATSAKNALKSGLFAAKDFIRPGEESSYEALDEALHHDLVPEGQFEHHHVDEIRRAMWRLHRCGEVEAAMVVTCTDVNNPENPIPDAMQNEATAQLQHSVDRARAQCHRLLNRCTTELRKLQTERHTRNETTAAGTDLSHLGICDHHAVKKAIEEGRKDRRKTIPTRETSGRNPPQRRNGARVWIPTVSGARCKTNPPSRNSRCTCGSGQKYKRCCGRSGAQLPQAA